jgi:hypothetical protein
VFKPDSPIPLTSLARSGTGAGTPIEQLTTAMRSELGGAQTVWEALNSICVLSALVLPGLSCCSVTAVGPRGLRTVAASGYLARVLDVFQYRWEEGPAQDALAGETVASRRVAHERRWPWWARQAREVDVDAVAAIPIRCGDRVIGTLNLYGGLAGLPDDTLAAGAVLGEVVGVLLAPAVPAGPGEPAVISPPEVDAALAAAGSAAEDLPEAA